MTIRDLYAIGVRLLALYFVVVGFASLPVIYSAYEAAANSNFPNPGLFSLAPASQSILLVLAGILLLRLHKVPEGVAVDPPGAELIFRAGIQLIGVFFAVSGIIGVVSAIGEAIAIPSGWLFRLKDLIPSFLFLVTGLLLVFRAAFVTRVARVAT